MSPNFCLNSSYRLGDPVMSWGVDLWGRAVFSSVLEARTVREEVADGPREQCSSCVLRVLARLRFRSVLALSFGWTKFRMVRCRGANSPRVPGGRSACSPRTVRFLGFATGGSVNFNRQSAAQGRTVRGTDADSPRHQDGQSAWPVRTVRPS
jgi:hypothetical protein